MKTIADDVQRYLDGEGEFEGRPVLVTNNDFRVTTGQIYSRLHQDDQFAFADGKGLVKRGSDQQWRPLSFKEWETAILEIFTLAEFQEQVGEAPRRLVVAVRTVYVLSSLHLFYEFRLMAIRKNAAIIRTARVIHTPIATPPDFSPPPM